MDFITLVQNLREEVGATGTDTTVVSPRVGSEWKRLIDWTALAWLEIQLMNPTRWKWMRKSFTFNTTVSQGAYTIAETGVADLAEWKENTFRVYLTASGTDDEQYLDFLPYDIFRDAYIFGTTRTNEDRPTVFTIDPDDGLIIWPKPSDVYTILGDYQTTPTALVDDGDIPDMPVRFHQLVVYDAMKKFAGYDAAVEVLGRAESESKTIRKALRLDQLPKLRRGKS